MLSSPLIFAAPLQGYTDCSWRMAHAAVLGEGGTPDAYFAPFIRMEKGVPRQRDLRDALAAQPAGIPCYPQVIFRDADELLPLIEELAGRGVRHIDLNIGCPFPPQVKKGRGAGLLASPERLSAALKVLASVTSVTFSAKMRLGVDSADQWREVIDAVNEAPLQWLTVHPRSAAQQYGGECNAEEFAAIAGEAAHPVVYNGDISSPADVTRVLSGDVNVAGVMVGRGLLARPSLIAEWRSGCEWEAMQRIQLLGRLHSLVLGDVKERFTGGDGQILTKMKTFWEYPSLYGEITRKAAKAVVKARSLAAYDDAVSNILSL